MLIDFHTHYFPDHIAKESMDKLAATAGVGYFGDGTFSGLLKFMKEDGVTLSVNQPVSTKPEQVKRINRKMVELNNAQKDVICFGALHPDYEDFESELTFLNQNGVKGIKLHSEYQNFCPEEKHMFKLYEACVKNNIMILFHAGVDLGYTSVRCTPKGIGEVLRVEGLKVILAHMGSYKMWDDVERELVGKDVYFDLAYTKVMENTQLKRIISDHGADKVLFASDFPWERPAVIKEKVLSLGLSSQDNDKIFYKNASKLLR